jgi:queuine/archaeosine tRNA-ribosyltransferase
VVNLIGGTTKASGGIWSRIRNELLKSDRLQGVMFQAMSFTEYGVTPDNLEWWREQSFHDRFDDLDVPVFVDSGGFKLMNSDTFGEAPSEGGVENEWGLYTDPRSILGLQVDFGGDLLATLDYPIPPKLNDQEQVERMKRSIESAVDCLELLDQPERLAESFEKNDRAAARLQQRIEAGEEPGVYVALHGHDYETVNWYVGRFLDRIEAESVGRSFEGFAVGSLVPLRSSTDVLVDIVQGAKDAIPDARRDDVGLHVFGIGGKQVSLLALLGVDSFDCSSHVQAAQYRKFIHPETWKRYTLSDLASLVDSDGSFPGQMDHGPLYGSDAITYDELVSGIRDDYDYEEMQRRKENDGKLKSYYYALLARHNFEVYNDEMARVRERIRDGELLSYLIEFAREHDDIAKGLRYAQRRDKRLQSAIRDRGAHDLLPGPEITSDQTTLAEWGVGVDNADQTRSISLKYGPESFDLRRRSFDPPTERTLLILPCSQEKPYANSRTHRVLWDKLGDRTDKIHKVSISGMYGPVPEEYEEEDPVMGYEYVLAKEDTRQIERVTARLVDFLREHGEGYDHILAYVTSKTYRQVVEDAFETYGRGEVFPRDPKALQLSEYFRNSNIEELLTYLDDNVV